MKKVLLTLLFMLFFQKKNIILANFNSEKCNIQNPSQENDCTFLNEKLDSDEACCFERFRINKIVTTRCIVIKKTEEDINDEKKFLRDKWGVKNLTILCSGQKLKFKYFFLLFEFFVLILI